MPECPSCNSQVDIEPAYKAYNFRGVFVRGQGARCRNCGTILEVSQWRALLVRFAPFILLVPFIWYRDTTVAMRIVILVFALGPFLVTMFHLIPGLYQLKMPGPERDVSSDDDLHY